MSKKPKSKLAGTAQVVPGEQSVAEANRAVHENAAGQEHATAAEAIHDKKGEPGTDPAPMIGRAHGTVEESEAPQHSKPDKGEAAAAAAAELTPTYKRISSAWQVAILPHWRQASKAEKKAFLKSIGVTPDLVS